MTKVRKATLEESARAIRLKLMEELISKLRANARVEYPALEAAPTA